MKIGETHRRLAALKSQVSALEQATAPMPTCLVLRPDDPVPADVAEYDSIHSIRRESQPARDLSACDDVLEIVIRRPRRPLIITRGSADQHPRSL